MERTLKKTEPNIEWKRLLLNDGRVRVMALAVLEMCPHFADRYPDDAGLDVIWQELEGPFWQRWTWRVSAVTECENKEEGGQVHGPLIWAVSETGHGVRPAVPLTPSLQASVLSVYADTIQTWKDRGLLHIADACRFAVPLPKHVIFMIMQKHMGYIGFSMARPFAKDFPLYASLLRRRRSVRQKLIHDPNFLQEIEGRSGTVGLTAHSLRQLLHALDSWRPILEAAPHAHAHARQEVLMQLGNWQSWAARLSYQMDPVAVALSKVRPSKTQRLALGRKCRLVKNALQRRRKIQMMATRFRQQPFVQHGNVVADEDVNLQAAGTCLVGKYSSWYALNTVMFSFHLKRSDMVHSALDAALNMAFPQAVARDLKHALEASAMPSEATMTRWRIQFDAALCLVQRKKFQDMCDPVTGKITGSVHLLVDSSPQGGRDWLLAELQLVGRLVPAGDLLLAFWQLADLMQSNNQDVEGEEKQELESMLMASLLAGFESWTLPPAALGHQKSNLHHKFHALVGSLFLSTGPLLHNVARSVASITTDFGTESGLSLMNVPLDLVSPAAAALHLVQSSRTVDHDDTEMPAVPDVDLTGSLQMPGGHHIMHNICADVCEAMPNFGQYKGHMQALSNFLSDSHLRSALRARCFATGESAEFSCRFESFSASLIDWRWQSVTDFLKAMEPLEQPLRKFWNVSFFVAGASTQFTAARRGGAVDQALAQHDEDESWRQMQILAMNNLLSNLLSQNASLSSRKHRSSMLESKSRPSVWIRP